MKIKPHGEERKQVKNLLHEVEGAIIDEVEIEDYNYLNDLGVDNDLEVWKGKPYVKPGGDSRGFYNSGKDKKGWKKRITRTFI